MSKIFVFLLSLSITATAAEITVIKPYDDYKKYSKEELRERIWDLEKAVRQLQQKVFELELSKAKEPKFGVGVIIGSGGASKSEEHTCYIQSFGKTFTDTQSSKAKAKANVLSQCSQATSAIHCEASDVQCD